MDAVPVHHRSELLVIERRSRGAWADVDVDMRVSLRAAERCDVRADCARRIRDRGGYALHDPLQVRPLVSGEVSLEPFHVPSRTDEHIAFLSGEVVQEGDHLAVLVHELRVGQQRPPLDDGAHEAAGPRQPVVRRGIDDSALLTHLWVTWSGLEVAAGDRQS